MVAAADTADHGAELEEARVVAVAAPPAPPATLAGGAMARTGTTTPSYAPARIAAASGSGGGSGRSDLAGPTDDALGDGFAAGARARRSAGDTPSEAPAPDEEAPTPAAHAATATGTAPTTETTTTTAVAPPPATTTARPAPPPEAVDPSTLPATPDRSTIQAVLSARTAAVTACANGAHGLADVDIVIASSGRITTATVNGPFAGTPVGSCIARAIRGATFPPFSQPRFEVTYPFHL
jgi:hypothetical protein